MENLSISVFFLARFPKQNNLVLFSNSRKNLSVKERVFKDDKAERYSFPV